MGEAIFSAVCALAATALSLLALILLFIPHAKVRIVAQWVAALALIAGGAYVLSGLFYMLVGVRGFSWRWETADPLLVTTPAFLLFMARWLRRGSQAKNAFFIAATLFGINIVGAAARIGWKEVTYYQLARTIQTRVEEERQRTGSYPTELPEELDLKSAERHFVYYAVKNGTSYKLYYTVEYWWHFGRQPEFTPPWPSGF